MPHHQYRVWCAHGYGQWKLRDQFHEFEAAGELCLHLEDTDVPWVLVDSDQQIVYDMRDATQAQIKWWLRRERIVRRP